MDSDFHEMAERAERRERDRMNIEQAVIENLRKLTPEKQREVLDFSRFLAEKTPREADTLTSREKAEDWLKFLESQTKDTPGLPDKAITREAIYD